MTIVNTYFTFYHFILNGSLTAKYYALPQKMAHPCPSEVPGRGNRDGTGAILPIYSQSLRQMEPSAIIPLDLPCSPAYSSHVEKGKRQEHDADSRAA
jgi:hypothetical protein